MASSKKKQDEKHLKILREMVALPHNKQCFDCHQRGPTYVNMTIGSYVCTACSGLLRGLNPPHRVKSISMASFTPEEMDFLKCHGNEFCRKVWLGLYDNRLGNQSESREENKVKDFMIQKYERKRYYVAPTEAMKEEAKKMNESVISKAPGTRPLKSLLGDNAPKLQVGNHQEDQNSSTVTTSVERQEDLFGSESQPQRGGDPFAPASITAEQPTENFIAPTASGPLSTGNALFGQTNADLSQLSSGSNFFSQDSGVGANDMVGLAADILQQNPLGIQQHPIPQQIVGLNPFNANGQGQMLDGQTCNPKDSFSSQAVQGHVQGQHNTFGSHGNMSDTNMLEGMQGNPQVHGGQNNQGLFGSQPSQVLTTSFVKQPKPVSATPPPISSTPQSPGNQSVQSSKSSGSTAMDLLGDLGGDPFASSAPQTQTSTGGFADFGNFGNTGSQSSAFPSVAQQTSKPLPFAQSTPLQPFGSSSSTSTSQTVNGNVAPSAGGDKYSNLSDLFSSATTTDTETSVGAGWSLSSTSSGGGGINWNTSGSSTSTGGINWGGDTSTNTGTSGINWNSSSSQSSGNTSVGWGGTGSTSNTATTGISGMSWGAPSTVQSNGLGAPGNPFLQQSNVANPFGGGAGTSLSTQTSMAGASNPFGGQPAVAQPGGFGAFGTQAGGFGQFGAQQNTPVNSTPGQFGQFGGMQNGGFGAMTSTGGFGNVQTSTQAGYRQAGQQQFAGQPAFGQQQQAAAGFGAMSQGGFGAQPAQGFGQPVGAFGAQPQQQMQGFPAQGGWAQAPAPSANPFMSTAQQYSAQPKSGTTNPFL